MCEGIVVEFFQAHLLELRYKKGKLKTGQARMGAVSSPGSSPSHFLPICFGRLSDQTFSLDHHFLVMDLFNCPHTTKLRPLALFFLIA